MTHRTRVLTALLAGALALPLLALPASAAGEATPPPEQDIRVFCSTPNAPQFSDVQSGDVFALAIRCLATADIVRGGPEGRPADQYGPGLSVRRGQMATFIAVMLDAADARDRNRRGDTFAGQVAPLPAYDGNNRFSDVPADDVHVASINRLAAAGIALGGPGDADDSAYVPNGLVSRAQMATFINRAVAFAQGEDPAQAGQGTGFTAPGGADYYTDDEASVHQARINGITSVGIAVGDGADTYRPAADVTRAQMAGFIARTLAQLFDDDRDHSLFEVYTGFFAPSSRVAEEREVATDTASALTVRDLQAGFLDAGVELRLTLVTCENVTRGADDVVTFAVDGSTGLADAGAPSTRITEVNGSPAPDGTTNSVAVTPAENGTVTVEIQNDTEEECVVAALYVNGGPGKALPEGGSNPRLEVDGQGRPVELFGISGSTTFVAGG